MKYAIAASMMALGLAACGGGGGNAKAEFIDECVKESGQDQAMCECQAEAMVDALGDDKFNKMVKLAKAGDEAAAEEMMTKLMTDDPSIAMKMGTAMLSCAS